MRSARYIVDRMIYIQTHTTNYNTLLRRDRMGVMKATTNF